MKVTPLSLLFFLTTLDFVASFAPSPSYRRAHTQAAGNAKVWRTVKNNDDDDNDMYVEPVENPGRRNLFINLAAGGIVVASGVTSWQFFNANAYTPPEFRRLATTQFIAALGDPTARKGTGAQEWGLWRKDPGPRGVWLRYYSKELENNYNTAPAGWKFDPNDWWVEEHGLIMEAPQFPLSASRYLVTGGRQVTTGLTVFEDGRWELDQGTLYDVTHLPCRSARYTPNEQGNGSPANARLSDFPVKPGAIMPTVPGTDKQDYAVLFLVGKGV
jgi:hypothetical protein